MITPATESFPVLLFIKIEPFLLFITAVSLTNSPSVPLFLISIFPSFWIAPSIKTEEFVLLLIFNLPIESIVFICFPSSSFKLLITIPFSDSRARRLFSEGLLASSLPFWITPAVSIFPFEIIDVDAASLPSLFTVKEPALSTEPFILLFSKLLMTRVLSVLLVICISLYPFV